MGRRSTTDHRLNALGLVISILVFGTGLILFFRFHVGEGAHRAELFGLEKEFWLTVHQVTALGFLSSFAVHIQRHWKYLKAIAKRWRVNLPGKTRSTTGEQILLFVAALVAMWAGFYAWMAFPHATLGNEEFHRWIDRHNMVAIVFLIGMGVHIKRRWRRIFTSPRGATRRKASPVENHLTGGEDAS
jgi:hypothetical protein